MKTEMTIIHVSDWNMQDKAFKFPENKIEELAKRLKSMTKVWYESYNKELWDWSETWEWFLKYAVRTKGIEDAEYFIDWTEPVESVEEWEIS